MEYHYVVYVRLTDAKFASFFTSNGLGVFPTAVAMLTRDILPFFEDMTAIRKVF